MRIEKFFPLHYRGADKSLARQRRKQARKHVRDARDFNNIETRAVIKFFSPCKARRRRKFTPFWQKHYLVSFLVGLRTYQHPCMCSIFSGLYGFSVFLVFISYTARISRQTFIWNTIVSSVHGFWVKQRHKRASELSELSSQLSQRSICRFEPPETKGVPCALERRTDCHYQVDGVASLHVHGFGQREQQRMKWRNCKILYLLNLLTPDVNYSGRTAPLTSKVAFYIFI